MKFASSILIVVMVLHSQCGATCLADALGGKAAVAETSSEPPCHQHQQAPLGSSDKRGETGNPCSQSPIIEARSSIAGKVVLQFVAAAVTAAPVTTLDQPSALTLTVPHLPGTWCPAQSFLVLRI